MMVDSEVLVYVVAEGIVMKESQFAFHGFKLIDPNYWQVFFDVAAHVFCAFISSEGKIICSLSINLEVHMFDCGIK